MLKQKENTSGKLIMAVIVIGLAMFFNYVVLEGKFSWDYFFAGEKTPAPESAAPSP